MVSEKDRCGRYFSTKNRKICNCCIILDITGKLNPKKFDVVKQRIEPMSRNSRRPGPSKIEVVN